MRDAVAQARRGRLPLGLLGMMVLVVAVESYLARRSRDFTLDHATTWRWSGLSARRDAPGSQVLCFGDSLVKFGIAPRLVEGRTGRTACNLAVFDGSPPASYILLRRALDAGARPAALVVDGELLWKDPFCQPWLWPELARPDEAAGLAWTARDAHFLAAYAVSWALPSVRARHGLRATLRGERSRAGAAFDLNWRNWRANQGALMMPARFEASEANLAALDVPLAVHGAWSNHPVNAAYMTKFLDLASALDIPVFWLLPPQHPKYLQRFDRPNWSGAYRGYVREQVQRYPKLVVVDGQRSGYDASVVADLYHMNRRGASAFSLALGDIIRDRLAFGIARGPRWVELPGFVEPGDGLVEDIDQTMVAILREKRRRN